MSKHRAANTAQEKKRFFWPMKVVWLVALLVDNREEICWWLVGYFANNRMGICGLNHSSRLKSDLSMATIREPLWPSVGIPQSVDAKFFNKAAIICTLLHPDLLLVYTYIPLFHIQ